MKKVMLVILYVMSFGVLSAETEEFRVIAEKHMIEGEVAKCLFDKDYGKKSFKTSNVRIETANGLTFHVADYNDGTVIITSLDGDIRGYQGIYLNGEQKFWSTVVKFYKDHFEHRHIFGDVYSYSKKQTIEITK